MKKKKKHRRAEHKGNQNSTQTITINPVQLPYPIQAESNEVCFLK